MDDQIPRRRRELHKMDDDPGIYWFDCAPHKAKHYVYQVRAAGKQRWRTVHGSLRETRQVRDKHRIAAANLVPASTGLVTFGDLMTRYLERRAMFVRPNTLTSYRSLWCIVEGELAGMRLDTMSADAVERVLLGKLETYAPTTVLHIRTLLRSATLEAAQKRLISFDPLAGHAVQLPAIRPQPRPHWDAAMLLRAIDALQDDPLGLLIVGLGACGGLRRGEMLGLRWTDLDPDDGRAHEFSPQGIRPSGLRVLAVMQSLVRVPRGEQIYFPKTPLSRRFVPVIDRLQPMLAHEESDVYVVAFPRARRRIEAIDDSWHARRERLAMAGVPPIGLHGLRHTFATLLTDAEVHPWVAHRILGHKLPGMAGIYVHPSWAQLQDAVAKIEAFLNRVAEESAA